MLKLSKMSDYAVVILQQLSKKGNQGQNTASVAEATGLPSPTVSKILHRLSEAGIVISERGRFGGYRLKKVPTDLSLSELLIAFEGPVTLTDCLENSNSCDLAKHCAVAGRWSVVSKAISRVLDDITLADLLLSKADNAFDPDSINVRTI